jgi:hypothetical protein
MEYYSALKRRKSYDLQHIVDLKHVLQSEKSQAQKNKYCMMSNVESKTSKNQGIELW